MDPSIAYMEHLFNPDDDDFSGSNPAGHRMYDPTVAPLPPPHIIPAEDGATRIQYRFLKMTPDVGTKDQILNKLRDSVDRVNAEPVTNDEEKENKALKLRELEFERVRIENLDKFKSNPNFTTNDYFIYH